ncbi:hypothetical protein [Paenibacillus sp. J2TS4]|uniref:hypothetical protein n=1 Tax=Paenibacillus sp. J2TS4 TaxID=2807194 RepID=UPI001B2D09F5|nr:hypothetical protein [Paenibacillus sp. J2TS4]GIP33967.1 hypothetical protein J2TS4_31770 [Paenibacillus sp. J2TS4]
MTTRTLVRKPPHTTLEESELVKEAVLLPVLLTMIRRDMDRMQDQANKLCLPNIVVMQRVLEMIQIDLVKLKQRLRSAGIRIYSEVKDAQGIRCKYICRENRGSLTMSRSMVKAEISIIAGNYVHMRR